MVMKIFKAIVIIAILALYASPTLTYKPQGLWVDCAMKSPNKTRVYQNLGWERQLRGQYRMAIKAYQVANMLDATGDPEVYMNMGVCAAMMQ